MRLRQNQIKPAPAQPGIPIKEIIMLNATQALVLVRQILLIVGGMLVARGVIDEGALSALVDNSITAISALTVIVTVVYGLWRDRHAATLARAAQIPGATVVPPPGR